MDYKDMLENARARFSDQCRACPVCNGRACGNTIPGPGAKGPGNGAARNFDAWQRVLLHMDTLCEDAAPDTRLRLFGRDFALPVFAAPIGALAAHYGPGCDDYGFNDVLVPAMAKNGSAAFTGDGPDSGVMARAVRAIAQNGGLGVPTIKPWNLDTVLARLDELNAAGVFAAAMDVDAAGLALLKAMHADAGCKSVAELRQIVSYAKMPFIVKGVMTPRGAEKAVEAGAAGVLVSNHGGRVLGQTPATAEVLPGIVKAVAGRAVVLVDGGIRTGLDVFKALALGADAVLIGRPFVPAVYGGGEAGVALLLERYRAELADAMTMCGAHSLDEIGPDMVYIDK